MGIPKHVIEAAEAADDQLNSWANGEDQGDSDQVDDVQTDNEEGEALDFDQFTGDDNHTQDTEPQFGEHGSVGDEAQDGEQAQGQQNQDSDWQQRALVAEGRLKALGPQVSQIQQLQQKIAQLEQAGAGNVEAQVQAYLQKQQAEQQKVAEQAAIRQQLADTWGLDDEGVELLDKYVGLRAPQAEPAAAAPSQPAQQAQTPADPGALYAQAVYAAHPSFHEINNDPAFHSWLQGTDTDGVSRSAKISQAHQAYQANVVIGMVNQFLLDSSGQQERQTQRQQAVQRQIAPSRSRGGSGQPQQQQKYLTPPQIQKFYDQFNRGQFAGRDDEWAKIKKLIDASERHYMGAG